MQLDIGKLTVKRKMLILKELKSGQRLSDLNFYAIISLKMFTTVSKQVFIIEPYLMEP